ncbi:Mur ligase family protein [uncultured Parolsenella sp.]|uniref:Mur ligase family protein n=1 Tax=uncultured Parolsenella sp. TaxID=2083008 RepID=UPI0025F67E02|nr:Mur ligase family protein [uncultured Parolsenella sp.]
MTSATTLLELCDLLDANDILVSGIPEEADANVTGAACDSRCVRKGNVFFCKGRAFKPAFLTSALETGAVAYICDPNHAEELAATAPSAPAIVTSDMRRAMALVSAAAFGRPDLDVPQVGITGTKGKSTTAYMLRYIIDAENGDKTCGIIGSIDTYDGAEDIESTNTTPEAPDLWRHLANAREHDLSAMVMEISSQALKYDRSLGLSLDVAAFLNIGADHISAVEHPTFEDYFASKLKIFSQCDNAVINLGTAHLERVLDAARAAGVESIVTVSTSGADPVECGSCDMVYPDIWATDIKPLGTQLTFVAHGTDAAEEDGARVEWQLPVTINFPGLFNVENALVAIACAKLLGVSDAAIVAGLAACRVPGRMELIGKPDSKVLCVVDYAHNTLSYQKFFASMTEEFPGRRIIALIGAPGGKAFERRVELPREAARWACHIVTTEEDPAHDSNEEICREMDGNVPEGATLADGTPVTHEYVLNREEAVARCLDVALGYEEPSLVCLLGKGDETLIHRGDEFQTMVPDGKAFENAAAARGIEL